jgi:hypothetical protein
VNDPTVFRRDCFKPNCATTLFNQRDSAVTVPIRRSRKTACRVHSRREPTARLRAHHRGATGRGWHPSVGVRHPCRSTADRRRYPLLHGDPPSRCRETATWQQTRRSRLLHQRLSASQAYPPPCGRMNICAPYFRPKPVEIVLRYEPPVCHLPAQHVHPCHVPTHPQETPHESSAQVQYRGRPGPRPTWQLVSVQVNDGLVMPGMKMLTG